MEVKRGRPAIGKKPGKAELQRLYIKESRSIRDVAKILGCSKDMVYRALNEYGIEKRSGIKRSKLRTYDLIFLKKEIERKGFRRVASELEVGITTLRDYMKADFR